MPTRASEAIVGWSMASHMKTENSWSTPSRWQYGGASHPQDSCIIPIAAPSTPRSRSASASKMSVSFLLDGKDRECPGQSAMAESFVATLKSEVLMHRRRFPDREVARSATFEYLEGFYNRRRLHSALSYLSPADYEEATMEGVAVA
jgi:putative transposase